MEAEGVPETVSVARESLVDLAVEAWRLKCWMDRFGQGAPTAMVQHVERRFRRFLEGVQIEVIDLTGKPFDPGLPVKVLDVTSGEAGSPSRIVEMVEPIVKLNGQVTRKGLVVVERAATTSIQE